MTKSQFQKRRMNKYRDRAKVNGEERSDWPAVGGEERVSASADTFYAFYSPVNMPRWLTQTTNSILMIVGYME